MLRAPLILVFASLIPGVHASAAIPTAEEIKAAKQWTKTVLLEGRAGKPFSFVYGGKPSSALVDRAAEGEFVLHGLRGAKDHFHVFDRAVTFGKEIEPGTMPPRHFERAYAEFRGAAQGYELAVPRGDS